MSLSAKQWWFTELAENIPTVEHSLLTMRYTITLTDKVNINDNGWPWTLVIKSNILDYVSCFFPFVAYNYYS